MVGLQKGPLCCLTRRILGLVVTVRPLSPARVPIPDAEKGMGEGDRARLRDTRNRRGSWRRLRGRRGLRSRRGSRSGRRGSRRTNRSQDRPGDRVVGREGRWQNRGRRGHRGERVGVGEGSEIGEATGSRPRGRRRRGSREREGDVGGM